MNGAEAASYGGGGPPLSGLGNFKGVMLCNRPSDIPAAKLGGGDGPEPFKSMVSSTHNEQLGLPPVKAAERPEGTVKKRGPSAALRQHVRWLRELQGQMHGERELGENEEKATEERKERIKATAAKGRDGVRQMMEERDNLKSRPPAKKVAAVKPLWAMTSKEKDDFEDEEADGLINFAENLDFEKYVGDLEFRQGIEAMKDRTGKIHKEQEAFKDALLRDFNSKLDEDDEETSVGSPRSLNLQDGVDGQSLLGDLKSEYSTSSSRRSQGAERYNNGQPDWDTSTSCGDGPQVNRELKDAATHILESAPQIRAIHSKESVQRIIEKAKQADQHTGNLVEHMKREGAVQVPVITSSEDTQQRLHKPPDPSNLPYLYRSPAV